jgi:hypothetical protein
MFARFSASAPRRFAMQSSNDYTFLEIIEIIS